MTDKKQARFKTEAEEAKWWSENQNLIAKRFEQAKTAGKLGKGTVARAAQGRSKASGALVLKGELLDKV